MLKSSLVWLVLASMRFARASFFASLRCWWYLLRADLKVARSMVSAGVPPSLQFFVGAFHSPEFRCVPAGLFGGYAGICWFEGGDLVGALDDPGGEVLDCLF